MLRRLAFPALLVADWSVLLGLRAAPAALGANVAHPHTWVARAGVDGAVATTAAGVLWCVAVWVGAGLLAALAARLPGAAGRAATVMTRCLLPRTLRRLVAGSLGLGVLLAPAAALARSAPGVGLAPSSAQPTVSSPVPAPRWPVSAGAGDAHHRSALPGPRWPTDPALTAAHRAPVAQPAAPSSARPDGASGDRPTVTVRPGDSLWLIAARRLGPDAGPEQIAAAWPRWYAANRAEIGDDPGLLRPGEILRAPVATHPGRAAGEASR